MPSLPMQSLSGTKAIRYQRSTRGIGWARLQRLTDEMGKVTTVDENEFVDVNTCLIRVAMATIAIISFNAYIS